VPLPIFWPKECVVFTNINNDVMQRERKKMIIVAVIRSKNAYCIVSESVLEVKIIDDDDDERYRGECRIVREQEGKTTAIYVVVVR
jgi:hypothetical protein